MAMRRQKGVLMAFVLTVILGALMLVCPEVKAAETTGGYWSLTSGPVITPGLQEYYGTKHALSYKIDTAAGLIYHYRTTSYDTDADGHVEGHFTTSITMAPTKINGGETVTFNLNTSVDNNMKNFIHSNSINVYCNKIKFYRKSDDSNYGADLSISTGPNHVLQGSEIVYYKVPVGKEAGETMTILEETSQGQSSGGVMVGGISTEWTYKWVVQNQAPTPTPTQEPTQPTPQISKPGKAQVAKIANVKGAKVKVTVQAVSGATAYQIRYKVGNAKKWKTVKQSSGQLFTIKVKKGKKVSVQARACNAAGKGPWGKTKKLKTDKK
ncbi:MAG: hypothetical protein K5739_01185 [Lachnospiraceae bacterium]|nr:hypothetical protein [Lachnospiraceae bacterium]